VTYTARELHLVSRPDGAPTADNFLLTERRLQRPESGELLVRNLWLSVDPYMRKRMVDQPSYIAPFGLNAPLEGAAIGVVVESRDASYAPGDLVSHFSGWRDLAVIEGASATRIDPSIEAQAYLGPLGMPGLAAYVGLLEIGEPKPGETVFVSAAAGSVGSLVAQIARLKGCHVIGSTGSAAKAHWLRNEAGIDIVINYNEVDDLTAALTRAAPDGIDVYFDNVGGDHLEAAIDVANDFARIPLCGMIGQYNGKPVGPRNIFRAIEKRIKLQGYIVTDHASRRDALLRDVGQWISDGKIRWTDTIVDGLAQMPQAFADLFTGRNTGKMLVRLDAANGDA